MQGVRHAPRARPRTAAVTSRAPRAPAAPRNAAWARSRYKSLEPIRGGSSAGRNYGPGTHTLVNESQCPVVGAGGHALHPMVAWGPQHPSATHSW